MNNITIGLVAYFVGMITSVLYPYLTAYLEYKQPFDPKYAVSRIIGTVLTGLTVIISPGFTDWLERTSVGYQHPILYAVAVFLTTFGAGAIARETQKIGAVIINKT